MPYTDCLFCLNGSVIGKAEKSVSPSLSRVLKYFSITIVIVKNRCKLTDEKSWCIEEKFLIMQRKGSTKLNCKIDRSINIC